MLTIQCKQFEVYFFLLSLARETILGANSDRAMYKSKRCNIIGRFISRINFRTDKLPIVTAQCLNQKDVI